MEITLTSCIRTEFYQTRISFPSSLSFFSSLCNFLMGYANGEKRVGMLNYGFL